MSDPRSPKPIRAFLDANVLFAAAVGGGTSRLWSLTGVQLVTSEYAAHEAWTNLGDEHRVRLLELLEPPLEFVPDRESTVPLFCAWTLPDPTDVPILLGAIESRCDYLLTGDSDCFGAFYGTRLDGVMILKPGKFLAAHGVHKPK